MTEDDVRWVAHILWVEAGMPKEGASAFYEEARTLINSVRSTQRREQPEGRNAKDGDPSAAG